jgi:predicted dehydrogenase
VTHRSDGRGRGASRDPGNPQGDRRHPAVAERDHGLARQFVTDGRLGTSGTYGRSICRTGSSTHTSRWSGGLDEKAGSGALGDIGAHIIDTAQFIMGDSIVGVSALMKLSQKSGPSRRPLPASARPAAP